MEIKAKQSRPDPHSYLVSLIIKSNYSQKAICKHLGISKQMMIRYINESINTMTIEEIIKLGGLLSVPPEELFYCLLRNRPKEAKDNWYLSNIRK